MNDRETVIRALGAVTDVPLDTMLQPNRNRTRAIARHAVMYYLRTQLMWTHERIGNALNRHYSAVIYGSQHFADLLFVKDREATTMWEELQKL